ncbi:MAG: hypothetical protein ABII39_06955 [Candidatus Micrarchaeota archaeon]|nr:hypothetical protein [Patescibacteria group bacterium]
MRYLLALILILGFFSVAFGTYYPLDDMRDGCLDYVEPGINNIVGNPDTEITIGYYVSEHEKGVFMYDFDFDIGYPKAQMNELYFEIQRNGYFDRESYYTGSPLILAKVNNVRAVFGKWNNNLLRLSPSQPLFSGTNHFFLMNTSEEALGSLCGCPSGTLNVPGLCTFRVCGFYPELDIKTNATPATISEDEEVKIKVSIINEDEVDSGATVVKIFGSDFSITPNPATDTILAKSESPFNRLDYIVTLTPKHYVELDTGLDSVQKRLGIITVTFEDVAGKTRIYEKDLGGIIVMKKPVIADPEPEEPIKIEPKSPTQFEVEKIPKEKDLNSTGNPETCYSMIFFILLSILAVCHISCHSQE